MYMRYFYSIVLLFINIIFIVNTLCTQSWIFFWKNKLMKESTKKNEKDFHTE